MTNIFCQEIQREKYYGKHILLQIQGGQTMKFSYIVPIVAVVYFGLHILAYYLTPLFI